ncbi:beta-galactosidase [Actinotalea sp. BY-33]|uniref:Beta-galactosidase n=1 Tax=Actinotalea soli TaxID=2819234 RepID=A0A939RVH5_9CELL|nr:beta-galactosidase [Actinotalea soli]MBO1751136.1 beta-galactosidase [Actinotalea soli]
MTEQVPHDGTNRTHEGLAPSAVRHRPWTGPLTRPAMANEQDQRPGLGLTNRYLERDGAPVIPVSGEIHYSRVPRDRWAERLRLMRSGGITVVATYVFWIHHVEERGRPRFEGELDLGAFVDLCAETGLDVVLRIGPWCHGEVRNGGFPDWVQQADVAHRTDDPAYLELVREWFSQVATAVADRCGPDGPVIGIQIENEIYDQPTHVATLKGLAREAGLVAPLWTATAWGGAQLPVGEVLPLFGGYGDGFWVDADQPWDPTFREHHLFSHVWDDPGIGADLRSAAAQARLAPADRTPSPDLPAATCELGGGMATAYHRRPWPRALDVATVAHVKIGNGSAWQGYYMYAGGTNPWGLAGPEGPGLQESQATGYPNDLPRRSYDFHAPVGEAGDLAPSHAELRRQHAFLAAFGPALADMPSTLPEEMPTGVEDVTTLRWALRSDGRSGVLFLAWHQPHVPLDPYVDARFEVTLDDEVLTLPSRPVTIPPGTLARWPVAWSVGGLRIAWATASLLTVLDPAPGTDSDGDGETRAVPTLVLTAEPGIDVEVALAPDDVLHLEPSLTPHRITRGEGAVDLLVLDAETARTAWVREPGGRALLLSADALTWGADGAVQVRSASGAPQVRRYDPSRRSVVELALAGPLEPGPQDTVEPSDAPSSDRPVEPTERPGPGREDVALTEVRAAGQVPTDHGWHEGRQSAPGREAVDALAAVHELAVPAWALAAPRDVWLHVDWAGDVAEIRVDGVTVADRFWDGSRWTLDLGDLGVGPESTVTLHLLPLATASTIALPTEAAVRLAGASDQLGVVDRVEVIARRWWTVV